MISINFTNAYRYHFLLKQLVAILLAILLSKILNLGEIGKVELIFFFGYLFFHFWTQGFSQDALKRSGEKEYSGPEIFHFYLILLSLGLFVLLISSIGIIPFFQDIDLKSLRFFFGYLSVMSFSIKPILA
jgi:prolipoprotein diacylglyceryltransferase